MGGWGGGVGVKKGHWPFWLLRDKGGNGCCPLLLTCRQVAIKKYTGSLGEYNEFQFIQYPCVLKVIIQRVLCPWQASGKGA